MIASSAVSVPVDAAPSVATEPLSFPLISASGYDPMKPDIGMTAAACFDETPRGWTKLGTLCVPNSATLPGTSSASIGFEGLDRGLFEPGPTYDKLAACGIKWARCQTMWSRCETRKGVYDFSVLDDVVTNLSTRGIRPWFSVTFGNVLYMNNCRTRAAVGNVPTLYGTECRQAWCNYVRELVRRYKRHVTHWEIWNEPDLPQFWQPSTPSARDYLELLNVTRRVILEESPDAKIGMCTSTFGLRPWVKEFFQTGGAKEIDFWCGHAYGTVPEVFRSIQQTSGNGPGFLEEFAQVRAFVDANGGKDVEIWNGECGFPSWFPEGHWLYPKGVCKEGWQSQANQAKWLLRRFLTDRRAGIARTSFYQAADISRHYATATTTQKHPAEHGILNGWTCEPKMSYSAFGHYNALLATATLDASVHASLIPSQDAGASTVTATFRTAAGSPLFLYYTAFDFSLSYTGRCYAPRTDAELAVPAELAPVVPVLVDLLRGGVYAPAAGNVVKADNRILFRNLPLTDYPLVIADRSAVPLR